ncbi:MAG: ABC transporter permease [Chloroflexota bacterium]|nr:ABC transporter permease [Chloroflexota bacterium]
MAETASERRRREEEEQFAERGVSLWQDAWRRLLRNQMAVAGLVFIALMIFCFITADFLPPYSYRTADYDNTRISPRWPDHIFGTDRLGRDLFTRVWWGTRVSLTVAVIGSLTELVIGVTYGSISGYLGGRVDNYMMRFVDVMYGFPTLLFIILIMVVLPSESAIQGMINIFIAIGVTGWMRMARLIRGQYLSLREKEFVLAAQMIGAGPARIISRHLLPNSLGPAVVSLTLGIPTLILTEATLSFIGLGVPPPYPSWGQMINEGWQGLRASPHMTIFPGLAIIITMLAFNFVGDGLRDALDPTMRGAMLVSAARRKKKKKARKAAAAAA